MVPGDLIEWCYKDSNNIVVYNEQMRSPTIEAYIPIGPELTHVLISIDGEKITWMNEKGLFHVCG